jgi:NAD-dependent DNA ligase
MSIKNLMNRFRDKNSKFLDKIDLNGKYVVFTGTLKGMTRATAKVKLLEIGGIPTENVYGANYIVATEFTSTKYKKAMENNIPVLSEDEFLRAIN